MKTWTNPETRETFVLWSSLRNGTRLQGPAANGREGEGTKKSRDSIQPDKGVTGLKVERAEVRGGDWMPIAFDPIEVVAVDGKPTWHHPKGLVWTLEELQALVGGYIETYDLPDGTLALLDEDGRLKGLPANRAASARCLRSVVGPVAFASSRRAVLR